jgi:hypothetical protein
MRLKNLAEAIIVQSMEDLWSPIHKEESMDFFMGEGFRLSSEMAGMSAAHRLRLLLILRRSGQKGKKVNNSRHRVRSGGIHELSIF